MARRSTRLSTGNATPKAHKRTASTALTPDTTNSKRSKPTKTTPTKSQFFQDDEKDPPTTTTEDDDDDDDPEDASDALSDFQQSDSDPTSDSASATDDDEEYDSAEASKPRRKSKPTPKKKRVTNTTIATTTTKTNNLRHPDTATGLAPGTQLIIKKPKPRPAGKTPYADDTLHPNTLLFLADLKANNERSWLKMHDADFRQSEKDWHSFVEALTERLVEIDDSIPELPIKDLVFRIYRDVRFSKDPTPYKPFFSAAWSRTGRKSGPFSCYYVQISPKESFVGGGLWHPEAPPIAALRRDINRHPERLKNVLMNDDMRKTFLKGAPKQEAKVVKAFVASNAENALKTKPKGYEADHADIDLLRLRNYTVGTKLSDDEILGKGGIERIAELFACLKPFITYLNSVVVPDEEPSSSEDDEGDEEDGDSSSEDGEVDG